MICGGRVVAPHIFFFIFCKRMRMAGACGTADITIDARASAQMQRIFSSIRWRWRSRKDLRDRRKRKVIIFIDKELRVLVLA
jgi:hypothetical protein